MILDQKHARFQKLCRQFAETEFTKELLDKLEETGDFDWDIFKKMAKYGFCGVKIPKEYGGAGGDYLSYAILVEEFARVSPVLSIYANTSNSLGGGPLMLHSWKLAFVHPHSGERMEFETAKPAWSC